MHHLFVRVSEDQDRNPVVDTLSIQGYETQVFQKEQDAQLPELSTRYCSSVETRDYPSQQHYTLVKVSSFSCTLRIILQLYKTLLLLRLLARVPLLRDPLVILAEV